MKTSRLLAPLLFAVVAASACRDGRAAAPAALPGSAPSLDALGKGVVEGFVRGDTARLKGYVLSHEEYRDVVWPRLQIDTTTGVSFDWSWRDNQIRGGRAIGRHLHAMKEMPLTAVETRCTEEPRRFEGMTVIPGCRVTIRDGSGKTGEMRLFKSVIVTGGGYKIFRYDD